MLGNIQEGTSDLFWEANGGIYMRTVFISWMEVGDISKGNRVNFHFSRRYYYKVSSGGGCYDFFFFFFFFFEHMVIVI